MECRKGLVDGRVDHEGVRLCQVVYSMKTTLCGALFVSSYDLKSILCGRVRRLLEGERGKDFGLFGRTRISMAVVSIEISRRIIFSTTVIVSLVAIAVQRGRQIGIEA